MKVCNILYADTIFVSVRSTTWFLELRFLRMLSFLFLWYMSLALFTLNWLQTYISEDLVFSNLIKSIIWLLTDRWIDECSKLQDFGPIGQVKVYVHTANALSGDLKVHILFRKDNFTIFLNFEIKFKKHDQNLSYRKIY